MKEHLNKQVIVVGNNHHNTLGLVRSLGRGGMEVTCIIVDDSIKHSFVEKSRYIQRFKLVSSYEELLACLLSEWCSSPAPVFTTSDGIAEFLDSNYDLLSTRLILGNCGKRQGNLSYWMNKDKMLSKAAECGIKIPYSVHLKIDANKIILPPDIKYPCLVKPQKSSKASKDNFRICQSSNELQDALYEIADDCSDVLIQEYVERDYEFLIMGMRSASTKRIILPGGLHKLRTCKNRNNLGIFAYAYTTGKMDSSINAVALERFLEAIDYDGIFSMEFMVKGEESYFLEINLRNDGTQFCFEGAGVNLPLLWAKEAMGEDISSYPMHLEQKYCMVEVNYLKYMDWHHPKKAFQEWRDTSLFALVEKEDWKPAFYKFYYSLFRH